MILHMPLAMSVVDVISISCWCNFYHLWYHQCAGELSEVVYSVDRSETTTQDKYWFIWLVGWLV